MGGCSHPTHCPDEETETQRGAHGLNPAHQPVQGRAKPRPTPQASRATLADSFFLPSHLEQRPLCLPQLDEDPEGDAEHGGQRHEPAYAIAPGGVGVDVVILEGLVLDQKEDEDAL